MNAEKRTTDLLKLYDALLRRLLAAVDGEAPVKASLLDVARRFLSASASAAAAAAASRAAFMRRSSSFDGAAVRAAPPAAAAAAAAFAARKLSIRVALFFSML